MPCHLPQPHQHPGSLRSPNAANLEQATVYSVPTNGRTQTRMIPAFCTRDAVSKDGLGLPGYHGCGASRILATALYVG